MPTVAFDTMNMSTRWGLLRSFLNKTAAEKFVKDVNDDADDASPISSQEGPALFICFEISVFWS